MLPDVVSDRISASDIGFPILEHGAEIEEHDVVLRDDPDGRVVPGSRKRVRPGPDDAFVPVLLDSELSAGQGENVLFDIPL